MNLDESAAVATIIGAVASVISFFTGLFVEKKFEITSMLRFSIKTKIQSDTKTKQKLNQRDAEIMQSASTGRDGSPKNIATNDRGQTIIYEHGAIHVDNRRVGDEESAMLQPIIDEGLSSHADFICRQIRVLDPRLDLFERYGMAEGYLNKKNCKEAATTYARIFDEMITFVREFGDEQSERHIYLITTHTATVRDFITKEDDPQKLTEIVDEVQNDMMLFLSKKMK